jgi:WD40 repeat protein
VTGFNVGRFLRPGAGEPSPTRTHMVQELRHNSPLLGCRFDPTGQFVFAGAQDNTIQRWELAGGRRIALNGHRSWVRALAFQTAQRKLISGDYAGRVMIWPADAVLPKPERAIHAHRGWVRAIAVSPDGQHFATCGNDNRVKLWSCATGELIRAFSGHEWHVYNVAFHPGGTHLVSADLHGVVKDWTIADGRLVRTLDAGLLFRYDPTFRADHGGVRSMAFNAAGSLLACAGITDVTNAFAGVGRPAVVLFDWQSGQRRQVLRPQANFQGTAWGVVCHASGFIAAAGGGSGGVLWFWRPEQSASFHAVTLPNNARDLALHPDGNRFAIPFFDSMVRVYSMAG